MQTDKSHSGSIPYCAPLRKQEARASAIPIAEAEKRAEEARIAREKAEAEKKAEDEKPAKQRAESVKLEAEKAAASKKKRSKLLIICAVCAIIVIAAVPVITKEVTPGGSCREGESAYQSGKYYQAYKAFDAAGDYKDAPEQKKIAAFSYGEELSAKEDYGVAYNYYTSAGSYSDARSKATEAAENAARKSLREFNYGNASSRFGSSRNEAAKSYADNINYALRSADSWQKEDTQQNRTKLPDDVLIYKVNKTTVKKTVTTYGVLKAVPDGWATGSKYTDIRYSPENNALYCIDGKACTIIDIASGAISEIADCASMPMLLDDLVAYYASNKLYGLADKTEA